MARVYYIKIEAGHDITSCPVSILKQMNDKLQRIPFNLLLGITHFNEFNALKYGLSPYYRLYVGN